MRIEPVHRSQSKGRRSPMKRHALLICTIAFLVNTSALAANEFRLNKDGVGPIVIVAEVSVQGRDAQLKASARNDSGQPLRFAKFCVTAEGRTKGCDFE